MKERPIEPVTTTTCPNCNGVITAKFCPNCGQKRINEEDYSFMHFMGHAFHEFTHFDTKFFKSIKYLFIKPGKMTTDFIEGRRGSYMKPVQLFIIANITFFFLTHFISGYTIFATPLFAHMHNGAYSPLARNMVNSHLAKTGEQYLHYEERFNRVMNGQTKSLVIIMVPLFSLFSYLLYSKRRKYFVEHIFYGLHFFSFFLIILCSVIPIAVLLYKLCTKNAHLSLSDDNLLLAATLIVTFTYIYASSKRVFQEISGLTAIKSLVLTYSLLLIVLIYRAILFFSVYLLT